MLLSSKFLAIIVAVFLCIFYSIHGFASPFDTVNFGDNEEIFDQDNGENSENDTDGNSSNDSDNQPETVAVAEKKSEIKNRQYKVYNAAEIMLLDISNGQKIVKNSRDISAFKLHLHSCYKYTDDNNSISFAQIDVDNSSAIISNDMALPAAHTTKYLVYLKGCI